MQWEEVQQETELKQTTKNVSTLDVKKVGKLEQVQTNGNASRTTSLATFPRSLGSCLISRSSAQHPPVSLVYTLHTSALVAWWHNTQATTNPLASSRTEGLTE